MIPDINILDEEFRRNPHPEYARLRAQSPLARIQPFGSAMILRHHDCRTLLLDPRLGYETFPEDMPPEHPMASYGEMARRWMIFQSPPRHRKLREPFNEAFGGAAIKKSEALTRQVAREVLTPLRAEPFFDVVTEAIEPFASRVICDLLGLPPADHRTFIVWTRQIASGMDLSTDRAESRSEMITSGHTFMQFRRYFGQALEEGRLNPEAPLARILIEGSGDGCPMSRTEDLTANAALLAAAGHHTIINTIALSIETLLSRPEHAGMLRQPGTFAPLAVEELLRYSSAANMTRRIVLEPLPFYDHTLRPGQEIWLCLGSANRDERVFENPQDLNLNRKPNPHLALGQGIHSCIGGHLARLELKCFLEELATLSPKLHLDPEDPPTRHSNFVLHGWKSLFLRP